MHPLNQSCDLARAQGPEPNTGRALLRILTVSASPRAAQAMQASSMDAVAEERDQEVRNILTSIADLAQIMKDLSTLVIDQGTVLDRIDYNMEQVSLKVRTGNPAASAAQLGSLQLPGRQRSCF
jgi:hypothetical protein